MYIFLFFPILLQFIFLLFVIEYVYTIQKKQKKSNYPKGNTNSHPTIIDNSNKKFQHNLEEAGNLLPRLKKEMEHRMKRKIKVCLESNDNVGELKQKCQSLKQLERGLATYAERKADLPARSTDSTILPVSWIDARVLLQQHYYQQKKKQRIKKTKVSRSSLFK